MQVGDVEILGSELVMGRIKLDARSHSTVRLVTISYVPLPQSSQTDGLPLARLTLIGL